MSHVCAVHVMPPSHVDVVSHTTVQLAPPHVMGPLHAAVPPQVIAHSDACEQSMAPLHAELPHVTSQPSPGGQVTLAAHAPFFEQSMTHVSPWQTPIPAASHRAAHAPASAIGPDPELAAAPPAPPAPLAPAPLPADPPSPAP